MISSFKATSHRASRAWWLVDLPCPSEQLAIMLITRGGWLNFQLCRQSSSPCLKIINELEKLDEMITPPKYRRCCYNVLEVLKAIVQHFKIKSK